MIIWGALIIPIVTAIVVFLLFHHKVVWWEVLIPVVVSVLVIGGMKFGVEASLTRDIEYWGGWAKFAEYYEDWNEQQMRTRQVCTGVGKSQTCRTEIYYVTVYHPAQWKLMDSNSIVLNISKTKFEELAKRWDNRKFVDLHRSYHTNDGDKYVTNWNKMDKTLEKVFTKHTYSNRVQASSSVFNYDEKATIGYKLFEYPRISGYYLPSILGGKNDKDRKEALDLLDFWNAKVGRMKQVRMWILLFEGLGLDTGPDVGMAQEAKWIGGNKNEFVVTIGVGRQREVQWCHVFSWCEVEQLKVDVRNFVVDQEKLNLVNIVNYMVPRVKKKFVRKQFADFSYLTVEPPMWSILVAYLVTLLVNVGISFWIIKNEFENENSR